MVIQSTSSNETERLAEQIGRKLRGGEVIELVSDLGGGKTTFVRGLAKGMGSTDNVASPTFTISREYHSKTLTMHHFDFYRLPEPGITASELQEVIDEPRFVTVVEWANVVHDILPNNRLKISFKTISEATRELEFTCPYDLSYLTEGVA